MTFISYAINHEDVLLWRALRHISRGFYIDVGANDPVEYSVTKAFYDHGWHGINIEPLPAFQKVLHEQRPRDVNLSVAAGAADGEITLYDVTQVKGWATTDETVANVHRSKGLDLVESKVPLRTLSAICQDHVQSEIHFLKIDVEGGEEEVLRGMNFSRWRPWILLIEATVPNSQITSHGAWETLVVEQGYLFAYFDGLNRYYVADEHKNLLHSLSLQANVFDDFVSFRLADAWRALKDAGERAERTQTQVRELTQALETRQEEFERLALARDGATQKLAIWAQGLEQQVIAVHRSISWRITLPLRLLGRLCQVSRWGPRISLLPHDLIRRLISNDSLQKLLVPQIQRFPALENRLVRMAANMRTANAAATDAFAQLELPTVLQNLPVSTRNVLVDLNRVCNTASAERTTHATGH